MIGSRHLYLEKVGRSVENKYLCSEAAASKCSSVAIFLFLCAIEKNGCRNRTIIGVSKLFRFFYSTEKNRKRASNIYVKPQFRV